MNDQLTRNFKRSEFACKCGCGYDEIDPTLVDQIQLFRDLLWISTGVEAPITVTCGCRCADHNAHVGGAPHSYHKAGMAADLVFRRKLPVVAAGQLIQIACQLGMMEIGGIGVYPEQNFIHLDIRAIVLVSTWTKENGVYRYGVDFVEEVRKGVWP